MEMMTSFLLFFFLFSVPQRGAKSAVPQGIGIINGKSVKEQEAPLDTMAGVGSEQDRVKEIVFFLKWLVGIQIFLAFLVLSALLGILFVYNKKDKGNRSNRDRRQEEMMLQLLKEINTNISDTKRLLREKKEANKNEHPVQVALPDKTEEKMAQIVSSLKKMEELLNNMYLMEKSLKKVLEKMDMLLEKALSYRKEPPEGETGRVQEVKEFIKKDEEKGRQREQTRAHTSSTVTYRPTPEEIKREIEGRWEQMTPEEKKKYKERFEKNGYVLYDPVLENNVFFIDNLSDRERGWFEIEEVENLEKSNGVILSVVMPAVLDKEGYLKTRGRLKVVVNM